MSALQRLATTARNEFVPVSGYGGNLIREFGDEPKADLIDLRDIWLALWRNRYVIVLVVAAFLALLWR